MIAVLMSSVRRGDSVDRALYPVTTPFHRLKGVERDQKASFCLFQSLVNLTFIRAAGRISSVSKSQLRLDS